MKLACIMFKYFPYGGLQRDFMRIANIAMQQGDSIDVYALEWHGDIPAGMNVNVISVSALTNHGKYEKFVAAIQAPIEQGQYDCVIGFNKMPGLDVYYAADPCYEARVRRLRGRRDYLQRRRLGNGLHDHAGRAQRQVEPGGL